jgi:hypothetical protein
MDGRCWYTGDAGLFLHVYRSPELPAKTHWEGLGYVAGIMDTLGGSHGPSFTYLPIVYQDDGQVRILGWAVDLAETTHYRVELTFLPVATASP